MIKFFPIFCLIIQLVLGDNLSSLPISSSSVSRKLQTNDQPSRMSSFFPTLKPSFSPTYKPTKYPTSTPTSFPSTPPTSFPTSFPTPSPTAFPTAFPSSFPTPSPTSFPTISPTISITKSTTFPTSSPTSPTSFPTSFPSHIDSYPTSVPTSFPSSSPTSYPSSYPSSSPTFFPSSSPTTPTSTPTSSPTNIPSSIPTSAPTSIPSSAPTASPSLVPTFSPTFHPTFHPTSFPTPPGALGLDWWYLEQANINLYYLIENKTKQVSSNNRQLRAISIQMITETLAYSLNFLISECLAKNSPSLTTSYLYGGVKFEESNYYYKDESGSGGSGRGYNYENQFSYSMWAAKEESIIVVYSCIDQLSKDPSPLESLFSIAGVKDLKSIQITNNRLRTSSSPPSSAYSNIFRTEEIIQDDFSPFGLIIIIFSLIFMIFAVFFALKCFNVCKNNDQEDDALSSSTSPLSPPPSNVFNKLSKLMSPKTSKGFRLATQHDLDEEDDEEIEFVTLNTRNNLNNQTNIQNVIHNPLYSSISNNNNTLSLNNPDSSPSRVIFKNNSENLSEDYFEPYSVPKNQLKTQVNFFTESDENINFNNYPSISSQSSTSSTPTNKITIKTRRESLRELQENLHSPRYNK